ncbi:MAG: GspH/FimT family pseudopilin [Deltaproteobacteria bacterium]|nr:GspH/FimT family pseudopilin [Deltaproteobacteria bacterium]
MNIRMQNKRGFTLIELIVVVMLVGIIMMIALPGLQTWMAKSRLNGAARQIMADLTYARMTAVSEGNRFVVSILNDHEYRILDDDNDNGSVDTGEKVIVKDIKSNYPDITLSATGIFTFYPPGLAFGATCTVTNPSGSKNVIVSSGGRVRIQ